MAKAKSKEKSTKPKQASAGQGGPSAGRGKRALCLAVLLLAGLGANQQWWLDANTQREIRQRVQQAVKPGRRFVFRSALKAYRLSRQAKRWFRAPRELPLPTPQNSTPQFP